MMDISIMANRRCTWTSTEQGIKNFLNRLPQLGEVVRICGNIEPHCKYTVTFYNAAGRSFNFKGFSWWYRGTGPSGLAECLRKLNVEENVIQELTRFNPETHGDANNPNCFFINLV